MQSAWQFWLVFSICHFTNCARGIIRVTLHTISLCKNVYKSLWFSWTVDITYRERVRKSLLSKVNEHISEKYKMDTLRFHFADPCPNWMICATVPWMVLEVDSITKAAVVILMSSAVIASRLHRVTSLSSTILFSPKCFIKSSNSSVTSVSLSLCNSVLQSTLATPRLFWSPMPGFSTCRLQWQFAHCFDVI